MRTAECDLENQQTIVSEESDEPGGSQTHSVRVQALTRRFGDVKALDGVDLTIKRGEFISLLGPSGCGKTTLLRLIAGLDTPDSGAIYIDGVNTVDVPAHKRPVNTVFQSYALFPHMTVRANVAFGLKMKKVPGEEMDQRVKRVLEMVEITALADRKPAQLSGGQKQRVALARAIVNEPKVLLLDEPLGALDLKLRKQLQIELNQLQRRLGITFVYVTHDQDEALTMSDRIAVMDAGRIVQLGEAQQIYEQPKTRFVAQFLGSCNLFEARFQERQQDSLLFKTEIGQVAMPTSSNGHSHSANSKVTIAIRPEKVQFEPLNGHLNLNGFRGKVHDRVYNGAETQYVLKVGDCSLKSCALNFHTGANGFKVGQDVHVILPPDGLIMLED